MLSDEWLQRYRLLENFTAKWNGKGSGNGNAYDRGDYNSSFALRAVELKSAPADTNWILATRFEQLNDPHRPCPSVIFRGIQLMQLMLYKSD